MSISKIVWEFLLGKLTDYVAVPYIEGNNTVLAYLHTMYDHVHSESFVYPKLADSITLTSGSGAWGTEGDIIEIIPANTLLRTFDIHWANIFNMSVDAEYLVELYSGDEGEEVLIDDGIRAWKDATFLSGIETMGAQPVHIPQQIANTRISAKLYSSNVGTATLQINVKGHYY